MGKKKNLKQDSSEVGRDSHEPSPDARQGARNNTISPAREDPNAILKLP